MKTCTATIHYAVFLAFILLVTSSHASTDNDKIQQLLASPEAPGGVVFEIASADKDALQWAIPRIQLYTKRLRQKFPGLEVAIVSHGREQFALQEKNSKEYEKVHNAVKELSANGEVPVHICQTFAAWNDVAPEEFPEYISVSATGPQQVNDYLELGYKLIILRKQ